LLAFLLIRPEGSGTYSLVIIEAVTIHLPMTFE